MANFTFLPPPNAAMMSQGSAIWPMSESDWERHRSLIRQLYLEEDKPLKDVMAIMEREHGFKATAKMYKNRITKWKLDKRNKEHEVMAVVRRKRDRDAVGKASEFRVRGRLVNMGDVHRYLKRKGISIEDAINLSAPTPPELQCCTPHTIPQSPPSLEVFDGPQRIFVTMRHYVLGSLESKTWLMEDGQDFYMSVKRTGHKVSAGQFRNNVLTALDLLNNGSHSRAGYFLAEASALIRDILVQESPRTLDKVLDAILLLRNRWVECSNVILKQISSMANTVFPELHPIRQTFNWLSSRDSEVDTFLNVWKRFPDVFEGVMGALSADALQCRLDYLSRVESFQNPDKAQVQIYNTAEKCKELYGVHDLRYGQAMLAFASFLRDQRRHTEAAAAAKEVIRCASEGSFVNRIEVWCVGKEILALSEYENNDDESAEASLRQAIDVSGTTWGLQDGLTLRLLTRLERWLTSFGKREEAALVSKQIWEIGR